MSKASAGLFSKIARTPEPKCGGAFFVSGEHIAAVGTESGAEVSCVRKLRKASAGDGIPDSELSMTNGGEGGGRRIGNDLVNVAAGGD